MEIKTPTPFETFISGICDIYEVTGNQLGAKKLTGLAFGDKVVGYKRFYAAKTATVEINRVIQVQRQETITAKDNAVIGATRYKIEQIQQIPDTNPPVTVLTLRRIGVLS